MCLRSRNESETVSGSRNASDGHRYPATDPLSLAAIFDFSTSWPQPVFSSAPANFNACAITPRMSGSSRIAARLSTRIERTWLPVPSRWPSGHLAPRFEEEEPDPSRVENQREYRRAKLRFTYVPIHGAQNTTPGIESVLLFGRHCIRVTIIASLTMRPAHEDCLSNR